MAVVLTRPEGENEGLRQRLSAFDVVVLPLIELLALPLDEATRKTAMDLDLFDEIVFVSKSAVRFSMPYLERYWPQWPLKPRWLAVGSGTAEALESHNITAGFPDLAGSEGLLRLQALQEVGGHRVLISRGRGGRELLADELTGRGAVVEYLETYERRSVVQPELRELAAGSTLVVTSSEILQTAVSQLRGRQKTMHVVVPSERIETLARDSGFAQVVNARGASEQALYDAVQMVS